MAVPLAHATFNTNVYGFLNDIYTDTSEYYDSATGKTLAMINFQGQLRIGTRDWNENLHMVGNVLECVNN